jgi:hypothetical protein
MTEERLAEVLVDPDGLIEGALQDEDPDATPPEWDDSVDPQDLPQG